MEENAKTTEENKEAVEAFLKNLREQREKQMMEGQKQKLKREVLEAAGWGLLGVSSVILGYRLGYSSGMKAGIAQGQVLTKLQLFDAIFRL